MSDIQTYSVAIPQELAQYWGWLLAFGIALVALGVAAVARAFTATIASMLFFGCAPGDRVRNRNRPGGHGRALGRGFFHH